MLNKDDTIQSETTQSEEIAARWFCKNCIHLNKTCYGTKEYFTNCISKHYKEDKITQYESWKKDAVQAESLEDFCNRYHKHRMYHDRGEEYMKIDFQSHQNELNKYGYTIIPKGTSTTGEAVSYYGTLYNTGLTLDELRQIQHKMNIPTMNEITEQEAVKIERWAADNPELVNDITDRYKIKD